MASRWSLNMFGDFQFTTREASLFGRQTGNHIFTRENTGCRIIWDRAIHVSLTVQFNLSLHNDTGWVTCCRSCCKY